MNISKKNHLNESFLIFEVLGIWCHINMLAMVLVLSIQNMSVYVYSDWYRDNLADKIKGKRESMIS